MPVDYEEVYNIHQPRDNHIFLPTRKLYESILLGPRSLKLSDPVPGQRDTFGERLASFRAIAFIGTFTCRVPRPAYNTTVATNERLVEDCKLALVC